MQHTSTYLVPINKRITAGKKTTIGIEANGTILIYFEYFPKIVPLVDIAGDI